MQKQRQEQILHILESEKYATVKYLTHVLNCSTATINRDLNEMQQLGLLKRHYGGAEAVSGRHLPPLPVRQFYMQKEKRHNAAQAAKMIKDGETVFFDASTTLQQIVPFLAEKKDLTVITNSLFLATELSKYKMDVCCLGGNVKERPYVLDSEITIENAMKYRVDKMFFSIGSITLKGEVCASHYLLNSVMLNNSKERYLLTDRTKVVEQLPRILCDFSLLTGVISDFEFPDETITLYPTTRFITTM